MNNADQLNIMYAKSIDEYRTFFDLKWYAEFMAVTDGTKLAPLAFLFAANVRAAANCHALPWMMFNSLSAFCQGSREANRVHSDFAELMVSDLPSRMKGKIKRKQRNALYRALKEVEQTVNLATAQANLANDPEFSPKGIWEKFQEQPNQELLTGIWGSQRFVFGGLFFAYESFVKDVVGIALGEPGYTGFPFPALMADAKKHFGESVAKRCLEGKFFRIMQLARHALAHNSGKENDKLKKAMKVHGSAVIDIVDDLIQIMPRHNSALRRSIEKRSMILTKAAVSLPQFKLTTGTA